MDYFNSVEVGDRVWSSEYGWGVVIGISYDEGYSEYPIIVQFKGEYDDIKRYSLNGYRLHSDPKEQTLYWCEIKDGKHKAYKYNSSTLEEALKMHEESLSFYKKQFFKVDTKEKKDKMLAMMEICKKDIENIKSKLKEQR